MRLRHFSLWRCTPHMYALFSKYVVLAHLLWRITQRTLLSTQMDSGVVSSYALGGEAGAWG